MKLPALPFTLLAIAACLADTGLTSQGAMAARRQIHSPLDTATSEANASAPGKKVIQPALAAERAPAPSVRDGALNLSTLPTLLAGQFEGVPDHVSYIQVDKPLYKPGETIWFKIWDVRHKDRGPASVASNMVELVSPKGAVVIRKWLKNERGSANNDFALPDEAQGGEYTLRATGSDGVKVERAVIVSGFEAPRMKKTLEFVKKAYGAGDSVSATLELKRPTGEVLANKAISAVITVDGVELPRVKASTNAEGGALIRFDLPKTIATGDGLLTILVEDGGVTESISKSIPIVQKKLALSFFPEGGKLVAGLPSRMYFEAQTLQGKPADVEGRLIDDRGNAVATFASYKNGLGRFEFTPASGRSYHAEIKRPATVTEHYALPLVEEQGCVLRTFDDPDGKEAAIRAKVLCSERQKVVVASSMHDQLLDAGSIEAGNGSKSNPAGIIWLQGKDDPKTAGIARVTVFDRNLTPLAERVVFRHRRTRLGVTIEPDKKSYTPRGEVSLNVSTRDTQGKPVAADLALAVVDDTVISFADDKSGHLLSKLLLEPELPGKIEEPNFYLDLTEKQSALALELLMGARGYRRFEWRPVSPPLASAPGKPVMHREKALAVKEQAPVPLVAKEFRAQFLAAPEVKAKQEAKPESKPVTNAVPRLALPEPVPLVARQIDQADAKKAGVARKIVVQHEAQPAMAPPPPPAPVPAVPPALLAKDAPAAGFGRDADFERAARAKGDIARQAQQWAVQRVFPLPVHQQSALRDDFRDTVFWAPVVKTDASGKATVRFPLSDAVTSFRVFAEGVGGGALGREEKVFNSKLPFSLSAKLPLEVSSGDKPLIPVTLTNDSDAVQSMTLEADFGQLIHNPNPARIKADALGAGSRKSLFLPLDVTGTQGSTAVHLSAMGSGLKDDMVRNIPVAPLGFPQLWQQSGQIKGDVTHEIDVTGATPGSVQASVRVYTSPLSTMIAGLEGMLREPGGCFEQTSSTNYPNVMIMQYLKQHDVVAPALQEKSRGLLESGYRKLTGFEAHNKGYEWFGGDPGHEALTAYGLLEFIDMKDLTGNVDPAMLARTSSWLKARRDGKGGYLRDAKALDTFGRASPEVTNAYITWALVTAGESGMETEIAQSAKLAESTQDAYQLALASATLLTRPASTPPSKAALAAANKLARMQAATGEWRNADHSITRSGGLNLQIETTSLAVLALLQTGQHLEPARKGIDWLQAHRGGFGQWGATQATVLALKAMIAFDDATRIAPSSGTVSVMVDGVKVAEQSYEAGRREPLVFADLADKLPAGGKHTLTLRGSSTTALPYSLAVEYRSKQPASAKSAVVALTTHLARPELKMGETVRMEAVIRNTTQNGQPMTLARLGIPGGLSFQNWQLKELREKGQIAFFETRPREVIVYLRDMKPGEVKKLAIDLVASVPGSYTGPASSSYLYYNDSDKSWAAPVAVHIVP